jgi:protein-S-isoprenylcysteine O-methyltransferase Ste14
MSKLNQVARAFVWVGGALFVASLAVCAHAYLATWAARRPFEGTAADVVWNAMLFTLFATHHSLFAREGVRARLARWIPERLLRSTYVWTASLLLVAVVALWQPLGGTLYAAEGWRRLALASIQLAGVMVIAWSVGAISALELAGIRAAPADGLRSHGPYRLVRHPLYLGWALAVFGATPMTGDRLLFAAVSTLYLLVAMPWEEEALARAFGDKYRRYKKNVRWRMIPYVY